MFLTNFNSEKTVLLKLLEGFGSVSDINIWENTLNFFVHALLNTSTSHEVTDASLSLIRISASYLKPVLGDSSA
jgi:hypothetical protein